MTAATRRELQAAAIALLATIAIGSVLMLLDGKAPGSMWWAMVTRVFGDPYQIGQLLYRATSLVMTGLAVSIALDAGLFNIGVEGQVTAGVLACAGLGVALPAGTPAVIAIPLCVIAAAIAGGAVGWVIGALRALRGAHEVITSIMLNAIVIGAALYIGNRVLFRGGTTTGAPIAPGAELPLFGLGGSPLNASIVIAALAATVVWWLRSRTTWGQAWRATGQSPEAVRTTGISVSRVQILVMTGSGALAGLAATNFVLGHKHAFESGLGAGAGLTGISAALLGRMHPVGVAIAAIVIAFVQVGGLAIGDLVNKEPIEMLPGVVVLAAAAAGPWLRRTEGVR